MQTITYPLILSALLCIAFAYPLDYAKSIPASGDLNTAETVWDLFGHHGGRGYSGWGTAGAQPSAVVPAHGVQVVPAVQPIQTVPATHQYVNYPISYGAYPSYPNYGSYGNYYSKYPTAYSGYASGVPTYENYAIHGGHGFGKYGKY